MNYKTNDGGDVAVSDGKGNIRYIPRHLAENSNLMRTRELTPILAPVPFEYEADKSENLLEAESENAPIGESNNAPATPKKRGPKPKDKIVG